MSILKDFYNGDLCPVEEIISPEMRYRPLAKVIGDGREHFAQQLPTEDRERFKEWNKQINDYEEMIEYANFSYGLRLGMMFAFEITMGRDNG